MSKQEKFMERMRNMESVKTKVEHVVVNEETDRRDRRLQTTRDVKRTNRSFASTNQES